MKRKLNHLSSSLKRGWPFGTPSCGHCGEGGFHASCITFAPVQTTVQVQPYSKSKTSWAESATSAEGFLLLGCPCWRACPPPCALWSTPWSMALGAGLWPSSHAGLHSTYWDLMTTLLEIRTRWHKTGTSGRFSRMDQLQIPLLVNLASKPFQQMFVLRHWMLSGSFFPLPPRSKCQHNGNSHKLTDQH